MVVGILAAIMGVGGGFVTFPMFVYIFGVSSMTTVGTDILQIIFTAGLAAIGQYAIYGYVFYTLAMGMLIGSLLGIQVGALTTKVVKGIHIRGFYAVSIIAGFLNRVATLPKKFTELEVINIPKPICDGIETVGNILFWIVVAVFGIWIFGKFFANLGHVERGGLKMLIRHAKMFNLGLLLGISFLGVLFLIFQPIFPGEKTGLDFSDDLFNKLSKGSSYFIPAVAKDNEKFMGTNFSVNIKLDKPEQVESAVKILTTGGAQATAKETQLAISGDLGKLLGNID